MNTISNSKIKRTHLSRDAYLYIRQSTIRQVYEHTESTKRQYGLKQKAISLGWAIENVITIDSDLGQSGASAAERTGFQKLVSEVGLGHVGLVIGIEVSRLARSSSDWNRLLEICALTDTLIMDEDGIYDANDFNDRLLLGLKGTMSEAELHFLQARMRGGLLNKAKRGELKVPLPIGFAYDEKERIVLDPDQQVQQSIRMFFELFKRVGTAKGAIREFNKQGLKLPMRLYKGFRKGELLWVQMVNSRALQILHNPHYAGVYYYGKSQIQRTIHGKVSVKMPYNDWHIFLPNAHAGYITYEAFEHNQEILRSNTHMRSPERMKTPPREGPALIQGIVMCGKCGRRMTVQYNYYKGSILPIYVCQKAHTEFDEKVCQTIQGDGIDSEIRRILLEMVTPMALEVSLAVQKELSDRKQEIDNYYKKQVERARYEAELARHRYMRVDPENRLVANELESEWNIKLNELTEAQAFYEKQCKAELKSVNEHETANILRLATDFPRLWNDKNVPDRERKRMVRLLIEDVTLLKNDEITVNIRFKGGTTKTINLEKPIPVYEKCKTGNNIIVEIDQLSEDYTPEKIAEILNLKGLKSGKGYVFTDKSIMRIMRTYKIKSFYQRLKADILL